MPPLWGNDDGEDGGHKGRLVGGDVGSDVDGNVVVSAETPMAERRKNKMICQQMH